ncbi:zinc finger protein with KRAB and SCAN domains 7-like isoform X8 [Varanus komodoensis]|uniref:zinc finger protein with KRAB and SCAN domains 7-like isoform X8 n=1 Tax=Varanus komodoensis TaxID=61221 RepID=UPI001CF7A2F7|nr:zinc finger protein with KRAB and SCAN domains 7-like isoform X8 [Varanus komodoensis]
MEKSLESPGKVPRIVQVMYFKGLPRQFSQQTDMGLPQQWEAQWQEFLKTLQPAHVGWGNPPMADTVPWDDAKGFLAAFEQVAEACRWPREEWVGRLLPALRGGVEQLFCRLDPRDRGDYLKVKAAILRADAIRAEARRKHFRQCCYQELEGPRRAYVTLQELCRQWLKPEKHTKEQILELIIQEQLLALLPPEVQSWVQECGPEDCIETVALAEDFLMSGRRRHAAKAWDWQVPTASSLDAERPQRQHCAGVSRNGDREAGLMASEAAPARNPGLVFPPEGQEAAGVAPPEEPVGVKDALDLSQTPLHWEVMRENSGSSSGSAVEGLLIPTPEMDTQPGQQEAVFAPRPEHGEAVPDHFLAAAEETGKIGDNTLQLKPEGPGVASPTGESSPPRPVSRLRPRSSQGLGVPGIKSLRVVLTKLGSPKKNDHHACPECGFKSDWLSEVIRHTRTHTGERPYTCPDCGKAYRWISNLSRHRKSNICSTNSASPDGSTEESQQADGDTELPEMKDYLQKIIKLEDICVSTTEASSQSISLKQEPCENEPESWGHQGTVQDSSQPPQITTEKEPTDFQKKHACSECGYHAESLSEIVIHTKTHIGEKTFECPDCGKAFRWWSNLLKHRQVHLSYQQAPALETSEVPSPSVAECDVILSDEEELINILAKNPQRGGTKLEGRRGPLSGELSAAASLDFEASVGSATSKGETEGNTRPARFPRNAAAVKANKFNRRERKHECPDCGHRTFYLSDLVRHQRTHTGERPYKCPECKKGFSQKSYLRIHLKVHTTSSGGLINGKKLVRRKKNNQIERKHTCSKCGHKTYKLSTLLMHMKIHTGEKPYKCLECGQTFNWSSNLSRHKRLHQFKRDFNTRKASQQEKWREGLGTCFRNQAHLTLSGYRKEQVSPTPQHSFRSQTIEPGNKTPDVQTEANPPQGKRGDGLPAATNGDASVVAALSERWGYNKQQEGKKDPEGSEGSVQDHDGPVTERKDNLGKKEAEVRARLEKFAYFKGEEVDICQSELSNCQAARAKKKAPYTCSECGKCFRVKRNLADHLNSHTGGKPYQCCECGRCFSWKSKLMRHRIIHTGVKPFHCAECGKDFFRKDSLRVHLKTHGFYPSYGCSECGWSFDQWDQLVRHQRAHTR